MKVTELGARWTYSRVRSAWAWQNGWLVWKGWRKLVWCWEMENLKCQPMECGLDRHLDFIQIAYRI